MSIISITEKKWNLVGSTIPGTGSADPDPHQYEADPKHCYIILLIDDLKSRSSALDHQEKK